jgi:hypothetical protein
MNTDTEARQATQPSRTAIDTIHLSGKGSKRLTHTSIEIPNAKYLKECFNYDAVTGALTWKKRPLRHFKAINAKRQQRRLYNLALTHAGKPAGRVHVTGHISVRLDGIEYPAHRLIWMLSNGTIPTGVIRHINGDKKDNRLSNLQPFTRSELGVITNPKSTKVTNRPTGLPTVEFLKECFNYDKRTVFLTWKERPLTHFKSNAAMKRWNAEYAGQHAGRWQGDGYIHIVPQLPFNTFRGHDIIWMLCNNRQPSNKIIHIDGDKTNNQASNLKESTTEPPKPTFKYVSTGSGSTLVEWYILEGYPHIAGSHCPKSIAHNYRIASQNRPWEYRYFEPLDVSEVKKLRLWRG